MKFKRILSLILAAMMLMGSIVTVSAEENKPMNFDDVAESDWFYNAVEFVFERGLMQGNSKTAFAPKKDLNRAMFVTIIGRLAGVSEDSTATDEFSDTDKDTWYSPYVGWAVENEIVSGYPDGTFRPMAPMSREQVATVISRYITNKGMNLPRESTAPDVFSDADEIADWAVDHVEVMRRAGIINGKSGETFQPKNNISRAETAQLIMNLIETEEKAWQGYQPDPQNDDSSVFGANYLYWGGTALSATLKTELDSETYGYPVLKSTYDKYTADEAGYPFTTSVGVCTTQEYVNLHETPVVKVAYKYRGMDEPAQIGGAMRINPTFTGWEWVGNDGYMVTYTEPFTFTKGADDAGFSTMTADLTSIMAKYTDLCDVADTIEPSMAPGVEQKKNNQYNSNIDATHLLVEAFEEGYNGDAAFDVLYIAFFKTQAEADAFEASQQDEYLKNYFRYSSLVFEELTDSIADEYDQKLVDRINEILNLGNTVDPEEITASGHKVYYISEKNGDDNKDGLTPETAWKTFKNLTYTVAGGTITRSVALPGDAVLFERGSEFYAEAYHVNVISCLGAWPGVIYSSYGEGEKPMFSCAVDFRDEGNTGTWIETEYDNIWELKNLEKEDRWNKKIDIGNIIFNGGEAIGVRVCPIYNSGESIGVNTVEQPDYTYVDEEATNPFLPGRVAYDYGFMTGDGKEVFRNGGYSCETLGETLRYNYQFFKDNYTGKLYLYFDKGNPGEYFDDIKVSRGGYSISGGGDETVLDNLAIMHSAMWGAAIGGHNIYIKNCEVGYVAGSAASIESGTEQFGASDGTYLYDNYVHDIGDGPLSLQSTKEWPDEGKDSFEPLHIQNAVQEGNVIAACGNGFEIWNHSGPVDGYGNAHNKIINLTIRDNYFAYIGYGLTQRQGHGERRGTGQVFCTYGDMYNCVNEDNVIMYPAGYIYGPHLSTDDQKHGWQQQSNIYIYNENHVDNYSGIGVFHKFNPHSYAFKGTAVTLPFNYRTLSFFASIGIETTSKFYYTNDANTAVEGENDLFFTTGYWIERGGFDPEA